MIYTVQVKFPIWTDNLSLYIYSMKNYRKILLPPGEIAEFFKTKYKPVDWYVKWIATVFILIGMALRTTQQFVFIDITLSLIGALGWMAVGIMWKDKALILLNAVATTILLYGFIIGINNV